MSHLLHLADVPEITISAGRWQPLNERLGITNFGISAVVVEPGEDPTSSTTRATAATRRSTSW
jgi:hypothetical protein